MGGRARRIMAGPRAPGWADVKLAMVTAARACELAAAELAADPGSAAAAGRVDRAVEVLAALAEQARCIELGEAVIEAERVRAAEEAVAAAGLIPAPRSGHLRAVR